MNFKFDTKDIARSKDDLVIIAGVDNITDEDLVSIGDVSNNTSDTYGWLGIYFYGKVQYKF